MSSVALAKRQSCPPDRANCSSSLASLTTTVISQTSQSLSTTSTPSSDGYNTSQITISTTLSGQSSSDSSSIPSTPSAPARTTASAQSSSPSPVVAATTSAPNAGTIAGSVIGGVLFLVLVLLGTLLYLRARKRKRTPPSSEFMNSLRDGAPPVLRLDSGAEYTPALPEKGGYTHYPPSVPLPFQQNSYYTSPAMQDMKFPDEMMMTDIPSRRPSIEKPLHPQRYSVQSQPNDAFVAQRHHPSSSVGSKRELWGRDADIVSREASPARLSPAPRESVLHFAPRFSLDDSHVHPPPSHSPTSLQPLRRQPDSEGT